MGKFLNSKSISSEKYIRTLMKDNLGKDLSVQLDIENKITTNWRKSKLHSSQHQNSLCPLFYCFL